MDRRKVLKNMGLSLGYVVATPTLISIMQACKEESVAAWTPDFFTKEQGSVLTSLIDIIIPKTDTPAASEVQVDLFIDRFANEVMLKEQQKLIKMGFSKFIDKALSNAGKDKAANLSSKDLEVVLSETLKISKEKNKDQAVALAKYTMAAKEESAANPSDELSRYAFASNLRGLTIWGYKTSEYVAENVLAYLPVPGEYIGCADLEQLTGGKAWSI